MTPRFARSLGAEQGRRDSASPVDQTSLAGSATVDACSGEISSEGLPRRACHPWLQRAPWPHVARMAEPLFRVPRGGAVLRLRVTGRNGRDHDSGQRT